MYCKNCGNEINKNDKFCKYCGHKFIENVESINIPVTNSTDSYISMDKSPYPYAISMWKLIIMYFFTFGLYEVYWFYKQWKSFNTTNKLKHGRLTLCILALFSPLTSYWLFKHVSGNIKEINQGKGLESKGLAILYFILTRFWLGFVPLLTVQDKINLFWENKFKDKLVRSNFGLWNWIVVISVVAFFVYSAYSSNESSASSTTTPTPTLFVEYPTQEEIASSVVNIFCPSTVKGEEVSGGSGTIITEKGIILTNSHIIPQDKYDHHVSEKGCLVTLPDPATGQPKEIYLANPIVIPDLSDKYDLAFMSIYDAYYDEDEYEYKGEYPKIFPAFNDTTNCSNEDIKLGESVRILGYPSISGGYSLTVTDGIVSSFPGNGLVTTSAKISHGNSGGLAVDKDGCMVGVPSLVSSDEFESMGVIYSMSLVNEFSTKVTNYLNRLSKEEKVNKYTDSGWE